jgi:hypothetical protein
VEADPLLNVIWDLIEIPLVLFRDDDSLDPVALGGDNFFLEPADGQNAPTRESSPVMARSFLIFSRGPDSAARLPW